MSLRPEGVVLRDHARISCAHSASEEKKDYETETRGETKDKAAFFQLPKSCFSQFLETQILEETLMQSLHLALTLYSSSLGVCTDFHLTLTLEKFLLQTSSFEDERGHYEKMLWAGRRRREFYRVCGLARSLPPPCWSSSSSEGALAGHHLSIKGPFARTRASQSVRRD